MKSVRIWALSKLEVNMGILSKLFFRLKGSLTKQIILYLWSLDGILKCDKQQEAICEQMGDEIYKDSK